MRNWPKKKTKDVLARSKSRDVEGLADIALALAHDDAGAQSLAMTLPGAVLTARLCRQLFAFSACATRAESYGHTESHRRLTKVGSL